MLPPPPPPTPPDLPDIISNRVHTDTSTTFVLGYSPPPPHPQIYLTSYPIVYTQIPVLPLFLGIPPPPQHPQIYLTSYPIVYTQIPVLPLFLGIPQIYLTSCPIVYTQIPVLPLFLGIPPPDLPDIISNRVHTDTSTTFVLGYSPHPQILLTSYPIVYTQIPVLPLFLGIPPPPTPPDLPDIISNRVHTDTSTTFVPGYSPLPQHPQIYLTSYPIVYTQIPVLPLFLGIPPPPDLPDIMSNRVHTDTSTTFVLGYSPPPRFTWHHIQSCTHRYQYYLCSWVFPTPPDLPDIISNRVHTDTSTTFVLGYSPPPQIYLTSYPIVYTQIPVLPLFLGIPPPPDLPDIMSNRVHTDTSTTFVLGYPPPPRFTWHHIQSCTHIYQYYLCSWVFPPPRFT